MPVDIVGWIEYSPYEQKEEREEKHAWITWMDVSSIVEFNDEINWILFGNPKDFHNPNPKFVPIAKERGFPENPGNSLQRYIEKTRDLKEIYNTNESFGFTHLYYSEITKIDWIKDYRLDLDKSDWFKLFELVDKFQELKRISSAQIRFTVWYDW